MTKRCNLFYCMPHKRNECCVSCKEKCINPCLNCPEQCGRETNVPMKAKELCTVLCKIKEGET